MQAQDLALFKAALGLTEPWQVTSVEFDPATKRLDLRIDFPRGATFCCPECDVAGLKAYDTEEKTWRHLDFFQHQAYLTARVPRVDCPEHKVRQVALPWARERSGFTLLFEALVMALVKEMPVATLAGLIGKEDKRVWRIVHHYVDAAVEAQDLEEVERVGIDETSSRRGHDYVSVFTDLDERRAVFVTEGRNHQTVQAFSLFLETHGGDPGEISEVCQDMSEAFLKGTLEPLPAAEVTFDRYHVRSHLSKAVDEVRPRGVKAPPRAAGQHQVHVAQVAGEPHREAARPARRAARPAASDRAGVHAGPAVRQLLRARGSRHRRGYLRRWITEVDSSGLEPLQHFARMLEDHWPG
ncbi:MAG: ISL3 family transposase [Solirubrobacteraceae bacterium]